MTYLKEVASVAPLRHTVHWEGREPWGNQGCCFAAALIVPTSSSLERKPSEGTGEERGCSEKGRELGAGRGC